MHHFAPLPARRLVIIAALSVLVSASTRAGDQSQWGQAWTRSLESAETGLPDCFDPETGRNVLWTAQLGTQTHSTPIIAGGRIYIGTNNANPRNPEITGDRGIFLCLKETDGSLLWQLAVPKRDEDKYFDWPDTGMSSPATVEGDRVYLLTNRHEIMCLDAHGMANGNDGPFLDEAGHMAPKGQPPVPAGMKDADIIWSLDLTTAAGVWPHDGAHSSILIRGDHLYVNTGTGVDNTHRLIRTPDAPSLVVVDKHTGKLLAREREGIAPQIFHATWSSPAMARIDDRDQIFFCGGNGIVYGFLPLPSPAPTGELSTLEKLWWFDPDPTAPKQQVHRFTTNRQEGPSNIYGMPVFHDGRLFVAGGGDVFWGKNEAWLKCIDLHGAKGDLTGTACLWTYPLTQHTLCTPVIHDGLVYATDTTGQLHCVDATTGKGIWVHPMNGVFWASPLVADGKIYIGTRKGHFCILAAGREKKVLCNLELKSPISATVTAANGTAYLATMNRLFALRVGASDQ